MQRLTIICVVLVVLGCGTCKVLLSNEDEEADRPPKIVVATNVDVTPAEENVIGARLQHTPGVVDVQYIATGVFAHVCLGSAA